MTFFTDRELAARIEGAEVDLTLHAGQALARREPGTIVARPGGGVAVFSGTGSPFDKVIGLGFGAPGAELLSFEEQVRSRGGAVQVELASLADPSMAEELARRRYGLAGFENVLARDLRDLSAPAHEVPGVEIAEVAPGDLDTWLDVVAGAATHEDVGDGPPSIEAFSVEAVKTALRDMAEASGFRCFLARREGRIAGGASMRVDVGRRLVQLGGAATLPAERRHGVHTALLRVRLARAAALGAELAVVTTRPGSRSQQNVVRSGFELVYVRAILRSSEP